MVIPGRSGNAQGGFTVIELVTVAALIGVLTAIAAPAMMRYKSVHDTRPAISQLGHKLRTARSEALTTAVPHLVLVQKEEIVEGKRTAFALFVRDNDRSYSITALDEVEEFELDPSFPLNVRQYGEDHALLPNTTSGSSSGSGSALDGDYMSLLGDYSAKMADGDATGDYSDVLAMYDDKAEDWAGAGSPGCSGAGPCLDPSHPDYEEALDPTSSGYDPAAVLALLNGTYSAGGSSSEVVNGATFPVSAAEEVPAFAFTERGIPVALDTPKAWGSGVGSVFVTDGRHVVYSASVSPLGQVTERRYSPETNSWK